MSGMSMQEGLCASGTYRDVIVRHVRVKNDQVLDIPLDVRQKINMEQKICKRCTQTRNVEGGGGGRGERDIIRHALTPLIRPHCQDLDTAYTQGTKKLDRALTVGASLILYLMNLPKNLVQKAPFDQFWKGIQSHKLHRRKIRLIDDSENVVI